MKSILPFFLLLLILCLTTCGKDDQGAEISHLSISGYAQKGQLIKGSDIAAYALNDHLIATGESFPGSISDDLGSFKITAEVAAPYLELRAQGYYFVENRGVTSESPIYLSALIDATQKDVNINLLTTITGARIKALMSGGMRFENAKKQAENEVLKAFSLQSNGLRGGFEQMNISQGGEADAILLAASCLIQEGRTAGEIQHIISKIASDLAEDGILSSDLIGELLSTQQEVSIVAVINNLINFYQEKGLSDFQIPPFYALLNTDYAQGTHLLTPASVSSTDRYDTEVDGGMKEYDLLSHEDFVVSSDVDWISATVVERCPKLYKVRLHIAANPDLTGRKGNTYVKSSSGDVLYTISTHQRGNGQRIYLNESKTTRSKAATECDMVHVNGTDYRPSYDVSLNKYYVDVPKSDAGYGVSNLPERVVSGENGDVLCATLFYPAEIQEFIEEEDAGSRNLSDKPLTTEGFNNKIPCYGSLKCIPGFELSNPAEVTLDVACSLVILQFEKKGTSTGVTFAKLEVETDVDGFLAGEVTTCMYPDQSLLDPSYVVPDTTYKNRSNRVVIDNTNADNKVGMLLHPQHLGRIKCTAYDTNGSLLFCIERDLNRVIERGVKLSLVLQLPE